MKSNLFKCCLMAVSFITASALVGCNKNENQSTNDDTQIANISAQFVDHTVAPTYSALASLTEQLTNQLTALKANPTNNGIQDACITFLAARQEWERSEAFLFGAAGDFGIDPHIDSWPLDEDAFNTLMGSPAMIAALDNEDGDVVAGERLGNALLGFHGIEYILFEDGHAKDVSKITPNEWIYITAVAGDLRNRCYQLEVGWLGDTAPKSHIDKLDDLEMPYTVAGGNLSYGENLRNAGRAGSTYSSPKAAIMAILQGCSDIADEVGSSKIYAAWHGEDITYIESPYSHMSITDFHNNIISIRNAYMGGVEGQRDESLSVHNYVNKGNPMIDAKIIQAIEEAISKIDVMPAPFVEHYSDAANGAVVKACAELSDAIGEAIDMIRNL